MRCITPVRKEGSLFLSSSAKRLLGLVVLTLAFCVGFFLYLVIYLIPGPPSVAAVHTPGGLHLYLATVPAAEGTDSHPTWVSYYAVDSNSQHWRHATTYVLPAHTVVQVTIYQYDSQTGLRNEFIGEARGTIGGTFTLDGKTVHTIDPSTASHIFAIPEMDVSVPLQGVSSSAKNPCANAPCPLSTDHHTTTFSFRTPGRGLYRWQCFVPCAAGWIQGLGGPMQTVGYMDGYVKVV
jgi:hypothetical protein